MFVPNSKLDMPELLYPGRKPVGRVKVDILDALSAKLRNVLVLNESFVNKGETPPYTRNEFEMLGTGSKSYDVFEDVKWLIGKSEFSFAFGVTPRAVDDNNMIFGMAKKTGAFNSYQTLAFWADNSDFNTSAVNCLAFQHSTTLGGGLASRVVSASNSIQPNTKYDIVCRQSLTSAEILIDGSISGASITTNLQPVSGSIDEAFLGALSVVLTKPMNGQLHYLYVFEGALTDVEARQIRDKNYRFIIPA